MTTAITTKPDKNNL